MAQNVIGHLKNLFKCNGNTFKKIGSNYYYIETIKKENWFEAAASCRRLNANLASIETEEEYEALIDYLKEKEYGDWFWLSGNDLGNEGDYVWLGTGQPMTYRKWYEGQPDNTAELEHCIHIWGINGEYGLNDAKCSEKELYICEADEKDMFTYA
ncbi:C-type lectin 37Da-like [Teleopsis dalmanni]|uniref:C-type lectin 37Da-like n=1 Tax=Teleopsis dalmanni TaxID=139649 RepID=UPI0018CDDA67|nr:C-type lectin 37Da-like [Teleopsis dalmanni]